MLPNFVTMFYIGPIPIQVWGLFVALGMVLSFVIIWKRGEKLGFESEKMLDLGALMLIGGVIGARLFHVFFYEPEYFFSYPNDIIKIWQGGLSSFGGIIGAGMVFYFFMIKGFILKEKVVQTVDLFAFSGLFGWLVGRIGCVMIHDHPGKLFDSILSFISVGGARLDMAALEVFGLLPLAIIFFVLRNKKMPDGWFINVLFIYYGTLRFVFDFLRATDLASSDARYLGLTPGQYSGIVLVVLGGILCWRKKKNNI